jgi:hypothetical protein
MHGVRWSMLCDTLRITMPHAQRVVLRGTRRASSRAASHVSYS